MPLVSTLVVGLVLAFVLGAIANRLKLPPLVGYLIAGIIVGPYSPGFVADQTLAPQLAEIGVILLMFGVGLHFSLADLLSVRGIAIPGALAQIAFATFLGWALSTALGWSLGGGIVFGLALSVASTVVLLKALQERRLVDTEKGKIAVGWLIVEDLAMVFALVLIPALATVSDGGDAGSDSIIGVVERLAGIDLGVGGIIALTIFKVGLFITVMLVVGRRVIPWALHRIAHSGSRELFRLGVLAIALGVAFAASELFGVSLALGAFFAGMVLAESELSHSAAEESLPLRDAFAVLFFVSVGMLFNPAIILSAPLTVLATVLIIVVGKSLAAFAIVLLFRRPMNTALIVSASLAQIGEFSFILAELGVGTGLLPEEGRDLILAGAIISIILNPFVFLFISKIQRKMAVREADGREGSANADHRRLEEPEPTSSLVSADHPNGAGATNLGTPAIANDGISSEAKEAGETGGEFENHTILVGYGRVGRIVGDRLFEGGKPVVVIEDSDSRIEDMKAKGMATVFGNAALEETLRLADIEAATSIVVAIPNAFESAHILAHARRLNPSIIAVARAHLDAEVDYLGKAGAQAVIMGEREIAKGMLKYLFGDELTGAYALANGPVTQ